MAKRTRKTTVKATDATTWNGASMRVVDMRAGMYKTQPFEYDAAVRLYSSWIYAAASINANAVASTPLRLYVRSNANTRKLWKTRPVGRKAYARLAGDGPRNPSPYVMRKAAEIGADFEEVVDGHPVLELLAVANPWVNGFDATVLRVVWQELTGNAYLHVVTNELGVPGQLLPMPPQWVRIIPDADKFVAGYRYGVGDEQSVTLAPDEVIHFRRPNPRNLWYGMGKLEAAWGAANANVALHEMDLAMFANHARPDYLLTIKGNAGSDELERLEKGIQSKLRGPRKSGHFLVSTTDIDLKPLQFPTKDIAGRTDVVEEIAAVFGVPVSMLRANDPNLASASVGYASWREMTVLPLCRMDEETLNQRLLPMFGIEGDAVLAYDDPVPAERQMDLTEMQVGVAGGWITPNEARARNGLEPLPDTAADRLYVNGQPLGATPGGFGLAAIAPSDATTAAAEPPDAPAVVVAGTTDAPASVKADDCVSEKIRTLIGEGFPADQAAAIAYEYCAERKALDDINTVPPQGVADNARMALDVRESKSPSQRGMTATGLARARDLANRRAVSEDTIRRMVAYFERHVGDKDGATWDDRGPGWQAWHGWGGDAGWNWAKRKRDEFDRARDEDGKSADSKSCGCCNDTTAGDAVAPADAHTTTAKSVSQTDVWFAPGSPIHVKAADDFGRLVDDDLVDDFTRRVDAVFARQIREAVAAIKAGGTPSAATIERVVEILRRGEFVDELRAAFAPFIERALAAGAGVGVERLVQLTGVPAVASLGWSSPELADYMQRMTTTLTVRAAETIGATRVERVADLLGNGLAAGEDTDALASRVQDWARPQDDERSERWRALRVARTESAFAMATAEQDAWAQTGLVSGKTWLLAPDPCEFCEAASKAFGKSGVGLRDPFYRVGDTLQGTDGGSYKFNYERVDGPPLHPNCRCAVQPVLVDDYERIAREAERRVREQ